MVSSRSGQGWEGDEFWGLLSFKGEWIERSSQEKSSCWTVIILVEQPLQFGLSLGHLAEVQDIGQVFLVNLSSILLEKKVPKCYPGSHPSSSCKSRMSNTSHLNTFIWSFSETSSSSNSLSMLNSSAYPLAHCPFIMKVLINPSKENCLSESSMSNFPDNFPW